MSVYLFKAVWCFKPLRRSCPGGPVGRKAGDCLACWLRSVDCRAWCYSLCAVACCGRAGLVLVAVVCLLAASLKKPLRLFAWGLLLFFVYFSPWLLLRLRLL